MTQSIFNIAAFVNRDRLDGSLRTIHSAFFHGYIYESHMLPPTWDARYSPKIAKNFYSSAPLIMPSVEILVREDVANACRRLRGVKLVSLTIEKCFRIPFRLGNHGDDNAYYDPDIDELFRSIDDDIDVRAVAPRYFRFVVPRLNAFAQKADSPHRFLLASKSSPYRDEVIRFDPNVFRENAAIWHTHGVLASQDFFECLSTYLDPVYFEVTEVKPL